MPLGSRLRSFQDALDRDIRYRRTIQSGGNTRRFRITGRRIFPSHRVFPATQRLLVSLVPLTSYPAFLRRPRTFVLSAQKRSYGSPPNALYSLAVSPSGYHLGSTFPR